MSQAPNGDFQSIFHDTRDLTPFREGYVRTPVRGLADGVGEVLSGVLTGRDPARLSVLGDVPRLKRLSTKQAKAMHEAVFTSTEPDRLISLGRLYPGWAGLCYVMAGLLAYKHGGYLRASELLRRGLTTRIDDDASQFSALYLGQVVTRVEVAERIEVPVLFSEESVFLALAHCLREMGMIEAALEAVVGLPPSLPSALARCTAAFSLDRHRDVVMCTEGLLNTDDLSAALLLIRARSQRARGDFESAQAALKEVLRRRKTSLALRNDALTDRALLALDQGRRTLTPRSRRPAPPAELEALEVIRKDAEMRRLWENDFRQLSGE
ncbi:tetratricopeptide (TPR) repeat protein [Arthrobacter sp. 2762]